MKKGKKNIQKLPGNSLMQFKQNNKGELLIDALFGLSISSILFFFISMIL